MGYLKQIKRLSQEDNIGGLLQIKVCRKADVLSIPSPVGRTVFGDITLQAGASFIPWDVTYARMQNGDNTTREGSTKQNSLQLSIPKDRINLRDMFTTMQDDEFVVIYTENGREKLFGLLHAPVRFGFSHDSGQDVGDANAFDVQFFYNGPDNIFFYDGSTGTPPTGPAPAVIKFNGSVIATLAPGQVLDIQSDYSYNDYFTS